MKPWSRDGQLITTELNQQEAQFLRLLVEQIKELIALRFQEHPQDELSELTGIRTGPSSTPVDPMPMGNANRRRSSSHSIAAPPCFCRLDMVCLLVDVMSCIGLFPGSPTSNAQGR